MGGTEEIGWCGLLRHTDRPGGAVISENAYGVRRLWETDSDDALDVYWSQLREEYDAFTAATRGHQGEGDDDQDQTSEAASDDQPRVWVGSLSDYNAGRLHGAWLDATLDPDDLHAAIQYLLRHSHEEAAEEWGIFDYEGFYAYGLSEYESLETVSRIAQGIAEHGEAFVRWVECIGETNTDTLERFEDHFLGAFDSMEAYVEQHLEDGDYYSFMAYVPEWLQPYVQVDTEMLARDMESELYVAEGNGGGMFVFDTRC